jgi:hypothetical protein
VAILRRISSLAKPHPGPRRGLFRKRKNALDRASGHGERNLSAPVFGTCQRLRRPSPIRTVPSALEFHQVSRSRMLSVSESRAQTVRHHRRSGISPCPEGLPYEVLLNEKALETSFQGKSKVSLSGFRFQDRMPKTALTFSHPDYTVGLGISPSQSLTDALRQRVAGSDCTSSPPVGNFTLP